MTARVFVSSAMEGYAECRDAARKAVASCGADPVMAEDAPHVGSPRNACMDGVASADVCLVVIGPRGGWTTPSGRLAVEEEYEEARRRHKIILVGVQRTARDADAERLVERITNYVSGHLRFEFDSCVDLEGAIVRHLPPLLQPLELPMRSVDDFGAVLGNVATAQYETTLRFVIAPERQEEVIDRVQIGTAAFAEQLQTLAHGRDVRFFDYRAAKSESMRGDDRVIEQNRRHVVDRRIEVTPAGMVVLDAIVSPRSENWNDGMMQMFFLVRSDVETALSASFQFTGALYAEIDRYERHHRFRYGVVFAGLGYRALVDRPEPRSSYSMSRDLREPLVIEQARAITRAALTAPQPEIDRIMTLLARRLS